MAMAMQRAKKNRGVLRRRRATESLIAFTEYTFERYRALPHFEKIAEALERPPAFA
jgi:hypothetical protein